MAMQLPASSVCSSVVKSNKAIPRDARQTNAICVSLKNLVEIERRAHEAIEGFIEVLAERGKPIPVEKHHTRRFTLNIQVKTPARA
jgi:hypothetical protein